MATRARFDVVLLALCAVLAFVPLELPAHAEEPPGDGPSATVEKPAAASDTPTTEPFDDRWRMDLPPYKLNTKGHWWDPYNQNVLKGDYPDPR